MPDLITGPVLFLNHSGRGTLAYEGAIRRESNPAIISKNLRKTRLPWIKLKNPARGPANCLAVTCEFAIILSRSFIPFLSWYFCRNSLLSLVISTLLGHSALQPLHERHRSITSKSLLLVRASWPSWPVIARRSALALPLVECSSSSVAL